MTTQSLDSRNLIYFVRGLCSFRKTGAVMQAAQSTSYVRGE